MSVPPPATGRHGGDPTIFGLAALGGLALGGAVAIAGALLRHKPISGDLIAVVSTTVFGLAAVRLRRVKPAMLPTYVVLTAVWIPVLLLAEIILVVQTGLGDRPLSGWLIASTAGPIGLYAAWLSPPVTAAAPFDNKWAADVFRLAAVMLGFIGIFAIIVMIVTAFGPGAEPPGSKDLLAISAVAAGALLGAIAPHAAETVPDQDLSLAGATTWIDAVLMGLAARYARLAPKPVDRVRISSWVACLTLGLLTLFALVGVASTMARGKPIPDGLLGIVGVATGTLTGWLISPPSMARGSQ